MLVLLDRDGVINQDAANGILTISEFIFLPRALEAIALLTNAGYTLAICTNQSAIGQGKLTVETLTEIHTYMCSKIEAVGGKIAMINFAPDHPDRATLRRKPGPGMLQEALQHFAAEPEKTPFVGDMLRDLEAATAAGCPRILVRSGKGAKQEATGIPVHVAPVKICDDLYAAAEYIRAEYRA